MADFSEVLKNERIYLNKRHDSKLVGLALSGGGVRSATFAIGAIQALAKAKLLSKFDYVSGVSGGCYALAWLVSWCTPDVDQKGAPSPPNKQMKGLAEFESELGKTQADSRAFEEAESINRVRKHSNFLTPHLDITKDDRWILLATYLLNLGANLALVLPLLFCVLFLPLSAAAAGRITSDVVRDVATALILFGWLASAYVAIAAKSNGEDRSKVNLFCAAAILLWYASLLLVFVHILPKHLDQLNAWLIHAAHSAVSSLPFRTKSSQYSVLVTAAFVFIFIAIQQTIRFEYIKELTSRMASQIAKRLLLRRPLLSLGVICAVSIVFAASMPLFYRYVAVANIFEAPANIKLFVFGPLTGSVALYIATVAALRILTDNLSETGKEAISWWLGRTLVYTIGLSCLSFVGFFGVNVFERFGPYLMVAAALFLACLVLSRMRRMQGHSFLGLLAFLGSAAPVAIGCSALLGLMELDGRLVCPGYAGKWDWVDCASSSKVIFSWLGALAIAVLMAGKGDRFSMTAFYRNRLINCYFPVRGDSDRSGLVNEKSDIPLARLADLDADGKRKYTGPYPIINVTLNSLRTRQLHWQERKACAFVFTPLFSGFDVPKSARIKGLHDDGFVKTESIGRNPITLGYASAVSGAAISPYMGSISSRPMAFLMALLNLRLGAWIVNTRLGEKRAKASPNRFETLIWELFGLTSEYHKYIYLSDGGHFENLGIYELVKRNCRVVVAIDSTQDPGYLWNSLAGAIEKCRVDLGAEISITDPVGEAIWKGCHLVRGIIRYNSGELGQFLCIKSCLHNDLPLDVTHYSRGNKAFPHDTTRNQWFGERQFESYRVLGEYVTHASIKETLAEVLSGERPKTRAASES